MAKLKGVFGIFCVQLLMLLVGTVEEKYPTSTYHLQIQLNYTNYEIQSPANFCARLTFQFKPTENARLIKMVATQLSIDALEIYDQSDRLILIRSVKQFEDRWEILLVDQVHARQTYRFKIRYSGKINNNGGFLVTRYSGRNGEKRYLLVNDPNKSFSTIMPHLSIQSTGSVELLVNVPSKWTAIFNSVEVEISREVSNPRMKLVRFKQTPQLAFNRFLLVIGDLSLATGRTKSGTLVRSLIPRDFDDFLQQTSRIPVGCLSSAESYLEQAIGVDKIDHLNLLGNWSFAASGIVVYPARNFSIWPDGPASDLLKQNLLVCKRTVESWLNRGEPLENGAEMFEGLSLFLSYRLVADFEGKEYAELVNEEIIRLSTSTQTASFIQQHSNNNYPYHSAQELAAILLMLEDVLGTQVFSQAVGIFVERVGKKTKEGVYRALIEAFQEATNYTPLCHTMMVRDLLESWLKTTGPAQLEISLIDRTYLIQQTTYPNRIVPLNIKEVGGQPLPIQWLMPSGQICSQIKNYWLDSRIPYTFNSNGKIYTRIGYSDEVHKLFIADGTNRISAGAQFTYIRDLDWQVIRDANKLTNLLEFIGHSFMETSVGSPLFARQAFQLLHYYTDETDKQVDDILKRQVQNLHNSIVWQPQKQTIRNALLSEQILVRSVLNQVAGSRTIAANFYELFLKECAPNFECESFPVEILSAVLCNSVLNSEDAPRQLLSQMIDDLSKRHDSILFESAERLLNEAWQCVYEI